MNRRRCLQLARRIDAQLRVALGEGIEPQRLLDDTLYARDVLLVCEAMPGTELATLASQFRAAHSQADGAERSGPQRPPLGIGGLLNSIFGPITEAPSEAGEDLESAEAQPAAGRGRRRWLPWGAPKTTAAEHVARTLAQRTDPRAGKR